MALSVEASCARIRQHSAAARGTATLHGSELAWGRSPTGYKRTYGGLHCRQGVDPGPSSQLRGWSCRRFAIDRRSTGLDFSARPGIPDRHGGGTHRLAVYPLHTYTIALFDAHSLATHPYPDAADIHTHAHSHSYPHPLSHPYLDGYLAAAGAGGGAASATAHDYAC